MKNTVAQLTSRMKILYVVFVFIGLAITVKLTAIQFGDETPSAYSKLRTEKIEARRGSILACNGEPLAISIPYYKVRFDSSAPADSTFRKEVKPLARELSRFFKDKSAQAYEEELKHARYGRKKPNRYLMLGNRTVNYSEFKEIEKFPMLRLGQFKGGLIKETINTRTKPYGSLANRTIGSINKNGVGVGIEVTYNNELEGKPGERLTQRVSGDRWIPVDYAETVKPVNGNDIRTTIDIEIQEIAETAVKKQLAVGDNFEAATAVVMEVATGAVKAIVNMRKGKDGQFHEAYNYAIGKPSEPGSTFKLVTLVCLLEDGYVTLDTQVDAGNGKWKYGGHTYSDVGHGLGVIDVRMAMKKSSNVAFTKLATKFYGDNPRAFVDRVMGLKVTDKLVLDIKAEGTARITDPDDPGWSVLSLPSMAIGYAIDITPLHTLTFYNAVANKGKMMKPYFIQSIEKDGEIIKNFPPQEIMGSICSKKTIKDATEALVGVIKGGRNDSKLFQIAGKTGTAKILLENGKYQNPDGSRKHQASFAGFFPADNPKYSAIVVMYSGLTHGNFYGGAWAAPVFKDIAEKIYACRCNWEEPLTENKNAIDSPEIIAGNAQEERLASNVLYMSERPDLPKEGWIRKDTTGISQMKWSEDGIPDVIGMGVKDAIFLLENEGFDVTFSGAGRVQKIDMISEKKIHLQLGITENKKKHNKA